MHSTPQDDRVNSQHPSSSASKTLGELAGLVGGELKGDPSVLISGAGGVEEAGPEEITYAAGPKFEALLKKSKAKAAIVSRSSAVDFVPVIRTDDPAKAFLKILLLWDPGRELLCLEGIHPTAVVHSTARIGSEVHLGPGVVIEEGAVVGDGATILAQSIIGRGVAVGKQALIYERVVIRDSCQIGDRVILHAGAVIGSDGFGYEVIDGRFTKVPQRGIVVVEEDVEVGANSCIDRARFGVTRIGRGTKIDNLVQIGHNVTIGEDSLIVSQVGIAGSAVLGRRVILGGQVGVAEHVQIGDETKIGAQSGVHTSVPAGAILLGTPPRPFREEKEIIVYTSRLPELFKEFRELKKKIARLLAEADGKAGLGSSE